MLPTTQLDSRGDGSTHEPAPAVARGTVVGRYLTLREVGRGGGGIVVEAFDPDLDRRVALKLLPIAAGRDRQELAHEARVLAQFTHPNIAAVHDIGATDEWVYIAMELVEGGDLAAWLGLRPREAAEILAVFVDAGRGLLAAHAKGLVHGDFKPGNVLVGDGRVRVTDFGLAKLDPATQRSLAPGDPRRGLVEDQPRTGGTPGFVAPEVERGCEPDARADQFAFCVSLLWALTGELRGEPADLEVRMARRGVPARTRRAVLRGISAAPDQRFPGMEPLLAELRPPGARRWPWLAGGLLGLGLAAGVAFARLGGGDAERVDACAAGQSALARAWSPERAAVLDAKLAGSTAPAALGAWIEAWRAAHLQLCGEPDPSPLTAARRRCLDDALGELDALTRALAEADTAVVDRAADAVARLGQPQACLRPDWRPPPRVAAPQADAAEAVLAAEEDLRMAEAYQRAGQVARALVLAEAARAVGEAANYQPVLAAAHYQLGRALMDEGRYDDAEQELRRAFAAALAGGDDRHLLASASLLLYCVGFSRGDAQGGALWQTLSAAALARTGGGTEAEAHYWDASGAFAVVRGDYAAGRDAYERALALRRVLFPPEHPELAWSLSGLAAIDVEQRAFADAERRSREVLELRRRALGPGHPDLIVAHTTLAAALTEQGKHDDAIVELEQAIAIGEARLGADSPRLVGVRNNLAAALNRRGEHARARGLYAAVLAHFQATRDADDPLVALAHNNLGGTYYKLDDPAAALEHHQRAREIWTARFGREHAKVALAHNGVAADLLALGRCPAAREAITEARAILPPGDPLTPHLDNTRAKVALCEGRAAEAAEAAEHALTHGRAVFGEQSPQLAAFLVTRALARLDLRDLTAARADALEAAARADAGNGNIRALALLLAARAARDAGDHDDARDLAVRALAAAPGEQARSPALRQEFARLPPG